MFLRIVGTYFFQYDFKYYLHKLYNSINFYLLKEFKTKNLLFFFLSNMYSNLIGTILSCSIFVTYLINLLVMQHEQTILNTFFLIIQIDFY